MKKKICDGKKEFKTKCYGEVKEYSFDIDLPKLNLCERHWVEILMNQTQGKPKKSTLKSNHKKEE